MILDLRGAVMKGSLSPIPLDGLGEAAAGDADLDAEAAADTAARPEMRLWLRLSASAALVGEILRAHLRDEFRITPARFDLLAHLSKAPDGLSMGDLSKRLMVTGGSVTGLADRLEREELVERFTLPGDRRTHFLRLTPTGRESFQAMAARYEAWLVDILAALGREETAQLMTLLAQLKRSARLAAG